MGFLDWDDTQSEATATSRKKTRLVVCLPECDTATRIVDEWGILKEFRLLAEDKTFINGFVAGLQLNKAQKQALLREYAEVWTRSAKNEKSVNKKHNRGRYAANAWIRMGASGFVDRLQE